MITLNSSRRGEHSYQRVRVLRHFMRCPEKGEIENTHLYKHTMFCHFSHRFTKKLSLYI